jgi:hypothetical protein
MLTLNKQYENNNFNPNRIWFWFLVWLTLLTIGFLSSCNPISKAENRVLADVESVKRVRAKTDELFPCNTEKPEPIYIRGRDIPVLYPVIDTTKLKALRDSINASKVDLNGYCDTYVDAAYKAGYDNAKADFKQSVRVDTFIKKIPPDTRELKKLNDSLTALRLREAEHKGELAAKDKQIKDANKAKTNWFLIALFSVILLLVIGFLTIYKTITNIFPIKKP